jgi:hypothetical protein
MKALQPAVGNQLKKMACLIFVLLLAGCLPIGIKGSNLPFAAVTIVAQ